MVVDTGNMDILVRLVLQHLNLDFVASLDYTYPRNVDLPPIWSSQILRHAVKINT